YSSPGDVLMFRLLALAAVAVAAWPSAAQDKPDTLDGTWVWRAKPGDPDQYLKITRLGNTVEVKGWYLKGAEEVGSYVGNDVKFSAGELTFKKKFTVRPKPGAWPDDILYTVKADSGQVTYTFTHDGATKTRALERVIESSPKDTSTAKDPAVLLPGTWEG